MAELLPSEVPLKKRKVEAAAAGLGGPCSQEPASLLSPSALLLQIPPCTNTSLPVWEHMRAAQVEALWSVTPYGITVQMTPLTSQKTQGKTHSSSQPAVLLKTQPSAQSVAVTQPSAQPMPVTQPSAQPVPVTQPSAQPVPVTQPSAQPVPVTQPSAQPVPVSQPSAKPVLVSQPSAKPVPVSQPSAKPVPVSQPSAQPVPVSQTSAQPVPVSQPSTQPVLATQPSGLQTSLSVSSFQPLSQPNPWVPVIQSAPSAQNLAHLYSFNQLPQLSFQTQTPSVTQALSTTLRQSRRQTVLAQCQILQSQLNKLKSHMPQPRPQHQGHPQPLPHPQPLAFPQPPQPLPLPQPQPHPQAPPASQIQPLPQLQPRPQPAPLGVRHEGAQDLPSKFVKLAAKTFYTKSSKRIHICENFLTGCCQFKLTCKMHHTPYPFHWQLRCSDTHQWVNVSLSAQVTLEKLYCDVARETIKLQDSWEQAGTDVFTLNFHTMRLMNSDKYDKVRRLSTSSDTERNPFLSTEWNFYWWNNSSWEKYETELSKGLLGAMEAGESWCRFHIGKQMYEVDFSGMTQRNVTTGFIRRVRRRPTFRSPFSLKSNLKTVVLVDTSTPVSQDLSSLNVDPLQEFSSWYPPVWTLTPDQGYSLVEVPPNTKAYQSIHSMFHQTMSENKVEIISVLQVQNVFQWDKYQRQKQHMQSLSPDQAGSLERHLFHGTTEDSAKEICQNNFDPRVSGKNGVAYGRGSYFARDASYSFKYAASSCQESCQHMFLAKVLVGNMTVGNSSYTRPPPLDPSNSGYELYDTCVNQIPNPSIFVVFDSCQCYPYFLIRYKVVPDIVNMKMAELLPSEVPLKKRKVEAAAAGLGGPCSQEPASLLSPSAEAHFTLHFDTMSVPNSEKYDIARRLSNSSDPERNRNFPTQWITYWWNDYQWEKYKQDPFLNVKAGESSCQLHIGRQVYEVDFNSMTQRNVTTGFIRRVRRRPTFRSPVSLKSHLKTVVLGDASQCFGQDLSSLNVDPLQEFSSWYPPVWTLTPDQGYSLVEVPPNTKAYQSIHSMFHQTMSENKVEIISIQQVQNVFLWDKYQRQKQHMQSRSPDQAGSLERHLFHGTTEDSAKEICQNNFDPRVSGKNGVVYGQGSYFARDASYSDKYAHVSGDKSSKHMFLAKVLVGKMTVGRTKFCRPPRLHPRKPGFELFDSCVDLKKDPSIFVVFDSCQSYPYYLITYEAKEDHQCRHHRQQSLMFPSNVPTRRSIPFT
ncbi:hypothetical protein JZ751_003567 [Albula glossodonta]|uniref:Poly [ADP-ribose] polymerase n=1 Tax=Albula glossodonta TaxID=121402 RepID=A0A8T2N939_9TELE|nr:hypothetical protein JZ751_003567 [Albula glossodonta]